MTAGLREWLASHAFVKVARQLLGWALAAAFVWFLFRSVVAYIDRIGPSGLVPEMNALIVAVCILFLWLLTFEAGAEWILRRSCMRDCRVPWRHTALAFYRAFLLRYVPGKIWTVLARVEGLAGVIPRPVMLRCVLYEQVHLNAATVFLVLLILPFVFEAEGQLNPYAMAGSFLLAAFGVAVWLFFPRTLFSWVNRIVAKLSREKTTEMLMLEGRLREWHGAFIIFILVVVLQSLPLIPLAWALIPDVEKLQLTQWLVLLGMYPVARVIGQMSMVAPAGVGVREGAYVILVLPVLDASISPMIVAWLRLLSVVPELGLYLLFKGINRQKNGA